MSGKSRRSGNKGRKSRKSVRKEKKSKKSRKSVTKSVTKAKYFLKKHKGKIALGLGLAGASAAYFTKHKWMPKVEELKKKVQEKYDTNIL
jgi:hypothetical protein